MAKQHSGHQQRGKSGSRKASTSGGEASDPSFLAVFPLPIFILPGGVTRLRIFEPRYINMVAEAGDAGGFVIACYWPDLPLNVADWGTKVEIIDFDQDKDGLLLIDVRAIHLVSLSDFERRPDNLLVARTQRRNHWSDRPITPLRTQALGTALHHLFDKHPLVENRYAEPQFDQLEWVCARFVELLPLSLEEKERFISPNSLPQLEKFLQLLILGEEKLDQ